MAASPVLKDLSPSDVFSAALKDSSGVVDMAVNGSSTAQTFEFLVPSNTALMVHSIGLVMNTASFAPASFGALTALTNGLRVELVNGSGAVVGKLHDGAIQTNADLHRWAGLGVFVHNTTPLAVRADFLMQTMFGADVVLPAGYKVRATVQDDLSSMTSLHMTVHGALRRS